MLGQPRHFISFLPFHHGFIVKIFAFSKVHNNNNIATMARIVRESAISINERIFLLDSLQSSGLRLDGRTVYDPRSLSIQFGVEPGSAMISLGGTRIYVSISASLVSPHIDRPAEGFLNFHLNFSPMASPYFDSIYSGQNNINHEKIVEITRLLDRIIRNSRAVDTEALCVVSGIKVWSVRVDLFLLDYNGNIVDAASLAAVLGLMHYKRPEVSVVSEKVTIHSIDERQPIPLALHHIPIAVTFALFPPRAGPSSPEAGPQDPIFVLDPALKEELTSECSVTISLNNFQEICSVQKSGGIGCSAQLMIKLTNLAQQRVEQLIETIKARIKEDAANPKARIQFNLLPKALKAPVNIENSLQNTVKTTEIKLKEPRKGQKHTEAVKMDSESSDSELEIIEKAKKNYHYSDSEGSSEEGSENDGSDVEMSAQQAEFQHVATKLAGKVDQKNTQASNPSNFQQPQSSKSKAQRKGK
jgi:exosome complex component RRP45